MYRASAAFSIFYLELIVIVTGIDNTQPIDVTADASYISKDYWIFLRGRISDCIYKGGNTYRYIII
jgi:hypothetical protein